MSSGFHTNELMKSLSRYPVAKGGPGSGPRPGQGGGVESHAYKAGQHWQVATALTGMAREETDPKLRDLLLRAAEAHVRAGGAHLDADNHPNDPTAENLAQQYTTAATEASRAAGRYERPRGEREYSDSVNKGAQRGHPFEGNQYTPMGSQAQAIENRAESMFHRDANGPERNTWGGNTDKDFEDIVSAHKQLEADHRAAAASEYAKGNTKAGDLHIAAARAHGDAGDAWRNSRAATGLAFAPNYSFAAYSRSGDATRATNHAVSNSSPDGVSKGAQPGHTFEGNQYVSGSNQASEARRLADAVKDGSADHFTAEGQHRVIARACEEQAKSASENGLKRLANAYTKAAKLHRDASAAHVNNLVIVNGKADPVKASEAAAKASEHADDLNYA